MQYAGQKSFIDVFAENIAVNLDFGGQVHHIRNSDVFHPI